MNKIKLFFVSDKTVSEKTLHSLYTTIRFLNDKVSNLEEDFKIWNEGRSIFIIMDENKIENLKNEFAFRNKGKDIKIKFVSKEKFILPSIKEDDIVTISGTLCYTYKYYNEDKIVEVCPININGKFKEKTKKSFINYLEINTGLNFLQAVDSKEDVRFERLFIDEKEIYNNNINKKVLNKNIVLVQATLKVINPEKTKALFYKMIGKKKSYGFGNMSVYKK